MRSPRSHMRGRDGAPGLPGPIPKHEWDGSKIRFQKTDATWGDWVEIRGFEGQAGKDAYSMAVEKGFQGSLEDWLSYLKGEDGKSAYDIAVENGFRGTPTEWLLSLNGKDGKNGLNGARGEKGEPGEKGDIGETGLSAYEVWLSMGNTGSEDDFFQWLAQKVKSLIKQVSSGGGSLRLKLGSLTDVDTAGATNGNALVFNGTKWVPGAGGAGAVDSVNNQTGDVELITDDIPEGYDLYFTNERAVTALSGEIDKINDAIITFIFDGGSSDITTGYKGVVMVPYAMDITEWVLLSEQTGDIVIDVWRSDYANYPPVIRNSITGTKKPTLSSSIKAQDTNLTTWDIDCPAGSIFAFNVDSASDIQKVSLFIFGKKK